MKRRHAAGRCTCMRGILISIKPRFASAIASGAKRVEFRRRASDAFAGAWALVYASQPTCAVVMRVRFGAVVRASPRELWTHYRRVAGVDRAGFDAYMAGCRHAWAIEIESVEVLDTPRDLAWLRARGVAAPMSYAMFASSAKWAKGMLPGEKERRAA